MRKCILIWRVSSVQGSRVACLSLDADMLFGETILGCICKFVCLALVHPGSDAKMHFELASVIGTGGAEALLACLLTPTAVCQGQFRKTNVSVEATCLHCLYRVMRCACSSI